MPEHSGSTLGLSAVMEAPVATDAGSPFTTVQQVLDPEPADILLVDPVLARRRHLLRLLTAEGLAVQGAGRLPRHCDAALVLVHLGAASPSDPATEAQLASLRVECAGTALAAIAECDAPEFGLLAVRCGLCGYLPSTLPPAMIAAAVALMRAGGLFIPPAALAQYARAQAAPDLPSAIAASLTSREDDVLGALLDGKPNKVIAHELRISESTVKVHIRSIMRKLKATNRTQVVCLSRMRPFPRLLPLRPLLGAPG